MTDPKNIPNTEFLIEMLNRYMNMIERKRLSPILNGRDLMRNFNLEPSPAFGPLLRRVQELYLGGAISDRREALRWVAGRLKKNTPRPTTGGA